MEEALLVPNIRFFFEHKPQTVDFHHRILNVRDVPADTTKQVEFDLCVGADGSHSFVRRQMMRVTRYVLWNPYVALSSTHHLRLAFMGRRYDESWRLDRTVDRWICCPEWTTSRSTFPTNIWSSKCQRLMMRRVTLHSLLIQITSTYGHAIHLCLWGCPIRCAVFRIDYYLAPLFLNGSLRDLIG